MACLYEALGVASVTSLPERSKRSTTQMEDFDENSKERMVKLGMTIMTKVCGIISPCDSNGLMNEILKREGIDHTVDGEKLAANMITLRNALPKGVIQSDAITAPLVMTVNSKVLKENMQLVNGKLLT